ncbi:50S ribosomal protein L13 [Candidatus Woesebacteria bacterium RIFCSPLOWO2_01_FULL_39_23]|uniref:Large ribosomal subunit protein uL13 n=2 Tax=Microgenomates group TaxID=1794810 RepID=A0A0H4TNV3_9BACT|nr:50S ribosomal protein L13, large subunit ribosomal protein L13 [uncultured Microgenomates bacterium Rifle_16ft_4_minimus_37633]OGM13899.1 MAG: 50S ribosomal protein L13 [Candidatus Woesebacteria bacterium RBG_16_40_11]OGM27851.1 MAG: 50S ribosomal protein L13 [Candidatus Woesebacteria bacterium RIFCSPHIGHO2_01_FULL_40_22]OGM36313.1 MAG: 50S ribosomal protein L13 [Candidatus Woesebacteria bacterium RIFCSPHIGHO2_12_FULL_38_9]OGM62273.1 MAG: 50S ribosomal protein L13 [Candidatus Woesebacteria b
MKTYKTYQPRQKDVIREWHLIDAKGAVLGRLATEVATYLTGKNKATYSNHMDVGGWVIVTNARDVILTGKKSIQKLYRSHSGFPGGFKEIKFEKMFAERPTKVIELAVSGMLPDNRLKSKRLARLKVYADEKHPYGNRFQNKQQSA